MVGKIIRAERLKQKIKSKDLSAAIGVDTGHLSHIEKGIRNPSKTILSKICKELNLSYQFMINVSNDTVEDNTNTYDATSHVPYKKILYAKDFELVDCSEEMAMEKVSLVTKMKDDSMEPLIKNGTKLFVVYTDLLNIGDICILSYGNKILVREFSKQENKIMLSPKNSKYDSIILDANNFELQIIGKIVKYN